MSHWISRRNEHPMNQLQKFIDDFWNQPMSTWGDRTEEKFSPKVEIKEKDDHISIKAEVPGMSEEDLVLNLHRDYLILKGEKQTDSESDKDGAHYTECHYGAFQRRIPLPYEINIEKASADYKNGVLKIELEKAETEKVRTRNIPIRS